METIETRSRARRTTLLAITFAGLLGAAMRSPASIRPTAAIVPLGPVRPQAQGSSRERSGLAEDQALLQRQLARLRQTMDILASRFEAEGRTHAAKLLREGLAHLGERADEQGAKTLDELMGGAKASLDSGQTMQAVEVQDSVVKSLEKLYAILTDRQGLDDLQHSLDDLRKIKTDLAGLADREKELRDRTNALERATASPQRKELEEGIQKAISAQRSLLARTETRARESGEMEMESIARELEALAARQATDAAVLESWKPEERSSLEAASPATLESQEHASTAQRLAQAAHEMREAAATARDAKSDLAAAQHGLETSADREERRERAAAESKEGRSPADTLPSKSLRTGARAIAEAAPTTEGREGAARAIEEQAQALEKAAEAELAAARENRAAAGAALARLAEQKTGAGEAAARAREALDTASKPDAGAKSLEDRAEEARRAAAEAGRALSAGLDEQATLPQALGASQKRSSEESARLERALAAHPEGNSSPGTQARKELEAAGESQKSASQSASEGRSTEAASAAHKAQDHLAAAREALERAREEAKSAGSASGQESSPGAAEEKALAKEQEELAKALDALEKKAAEADAAEAGRSGSEKSNADSPSSASKSSDSKASNGEPSENKSSGNKSSEGKPSDGKSTDGKSSDGKSPGGKPSEGKSPGSEPPGAKPSGADPSSSPSSGEKPSGSKDSPPSPSQGTKRELSAAKQAMQSAAKSLASRSPSAASKAQREALASLQRAGESGRENAPLTQPEDRAKAEELAKEQEKIRQELLELAKRNQKRDAAKPAPGLPKAGSSAAKAKKSLEEADLGEADQKEEDTEKQMREALSSLSEEEEQYQKLRAEELLFKVAEQVRALQEGHQEEIRETKEIDATRKPGEQATHTQRLRLRKVAKAEEALAGRAAEMEKAIRAEESLVFAEILDQVDRDLLHVSKDLGEEGGFQSGDRVQALQQDVDQGLAWLHQALQAEKDRRRQEDAQSPSGQSSSSPGHNRLVADAAELKLLRQLEVENIDSLEKFKAAHPDLGEAAARDPLLLEDLSRLANRHQRTSDLFEKFRKRLKFPDPDSQEP